MTDRNQVWENNIPSSDPKSVEVSFSVSDSKVSNKAVFCAHLIPTTVEDNCSCSFELRNKKDIIWFHRVVEAINFLLRDDPSLSFMIDGHECPTFLLFRLVRDLKQMKDAPEPIDPYTLYLNEHHEPLIIIQDYKP